MCDCGSSRTPGSGPFASGRELVEFVLNAHGGTVALSELPGGGLEHDCQGPACGGVHAVSPPRADDPQAIQYAGKDFALQLAA